MTVSIPRSRRVLKQATLPSHEVTISVARGERAESWQKLAGRVSPLAVLPEVRADIWGLHRPGELSKTFLTAVLRLPHNEQARPKLLALTGRCGNRDVVANWLRSYRIHERRRRPLTGGGFATDTARSVLTAITREDLEMAGQLLAGVLSAAPHSSILRVLEVWLAAESGVLDGDEARFALVALPFDEDDEARRMAKVLLHQGPILGARRRNLAAHVLRKLD